MNLKRTTTHGCSTCELHQHDARDSVVIDDCNVFNKGINKHSRTGYDGVISEI